MTAAVAASCSRTNPLSLTSSDLVERGEHPDHEGGGDGDGVAGLLQHHLVPPHQLKEREREERAFIRDVQQEIVERYHRKAGESTNKLRECESDQDGV